VVLLVMQVQEILEILVMQELEEMLVEGEMAAAEEEESVEKEMDLMMLELVEIREAILEVKE
jgi:hypothetical protein